MIPRFGELCSCCYLPLQIELAWKILANRGPLFSPALNIKQCERSSLGIACCTKCTLPSHLCLVIKVREPGNYASHKYYCLLHKYLGYVDRMQTTPHDCIWNRCVCSVKCMHAASLLLPPHSEGPSADTSADIILTPEQSWFWTSILQFCPRNHKTESFL